MLKRTEPSTILANHSVIQILTFNKTFTKRVGPYIIIFLLGPRFIPSTWRWVPAPLNPLPGTLLSNSTRHKNM